MVISHQFISMFTFWTFSLISAEVDPSLGTYSCYPCGRQLCGFADGGTEDVIVDTSGIANNDRAPPRSCKEIQYLSDLRAIDPEVCSIYSQITQSSSDPCDCRRRTSAFEESSMGDKCPNPNQPQPCALCGNGKIIGDPEKYIKDPRFPVPCVSIFDAQNENIAAGNGGYPTAICRDLQYVFANNCQCVRPGIAVTQCIQQEILDQPCDPSKSDDQCCAGACKYVHIFRNYFCTERPGDPAPPTSVPKGIPDPPTRVPTLYPTPYPTHVPTLPPSPAPTLGPTFVPSSPSLSPVRFPTFVPREDVNDSLQTSAPTPTFLLGFSGFTPNFTENARTPEPTSRSFFQSGGGAGSSNHNIRHPPKK